MKIEYWKHEDVQPDGSVGREPGGGAIFTEPGMRECGLVMYVSTGRLPDGTCHGITLHFNNLAEKRRFEESGEAAGTVMLVL